MYILDTNAFYYAAGISQCTYDIGKLHKIINENEGINIVGDVINPLLERYKDIMITYDDGVIERMQAECRRERINILSVLKVLGLLKGLNHEDIARIIY